VTAVSSPPTPQNVTTVPMRSPAIFPVSDRTICRLIDTGDTKAITPLRDCIRVPVEEIRELDERFMISF